MIVYHIVTRKYHEEGAELQLSQTLEHVITSRGVRYWCVFHENRKRDWKKSLDTQINVLSHPDTFTDR